MHMRPALLALVCVIATSTANAAFDVTDCLRKAKSTNDSELCAAAEADANQDELRKVVAQTVSDNDEATVIELTKAQALWEQFVDADCKAVYESYGQGTYRGSAAQEGRFDHTTQRIKELKAWNPAHWNPVK